MIAATSQPPWAAGEREKIKAVPTPGDLLLENNWFLFAQNMITAKPGKQVCLREGGCWGWGKKSGRGRGCENPILQKAIS